MKAFNNLFLILRKAANGLALPVLQHPGMFFTAVSLLLLPFLFNILCKVGLLSFVCHTSHIPWIGFSVFSTTFVLAYVFCLLQRFLRIGKVFVVVIALLVTVDIFLTMTFGMGISQMSLQLLLQSNGGEAEEFLYTYVLKPSAVVLFLVVLAVCCVGLSGKADARLRERMWANRQTSSYIIAALLVVPALAGCSKLRAAFRLLGTDDTYSLTLMIRQVPKDVVTKTVFAVKCVMAQRREVDTMLAVASRVRVDSCRFTSPEIIQVIGESFNKHHSSLYGYEADTNPCLSARRDNGGLFVFTDAVSPYNSTGEAMKSMLSSTRARSGESWAEGPLLPTVFRKAGYRVALLDNQVVAKSDCTPWDYMLAFFMYEPTLMEASYDWCNSRTFPFDGKLVDVVRDSLLADAAQAMGG